MAPQLELVPYPPTKRLLDKVVSLLLLAALAPVAAVAVVVIVVDALLVSADRGPLLYRERRISQGLEFDLLKFRTLRTDVIAELCRSSGYARTYEADEANLTRAGRLLKRWYVDELPQFVNVLRGEMSLVGPRAWPVVMVEQQVADGLDYRLRAVAGPRQRRQARPRVCRAVPAGGRPAPPGRRPTPPRTDRRGAGEGRGAQELTAPGG
jgi:lipopolysaccharide/colanic/teichoic acid biosynthesis glycosyltransferase